MLTRLSMGLLASVLAITPLPSTAQDGSAEDLGDVMSISLKDVIKPSFGVQGALQGAGTPNFAGIGAFFPFTVSNKSFWYLDVMANYDFADRHYYSSIVDTTIKGGTVSTSTRIGYRWLNDEKTNLYNLSVGYDSRPTASGYADSSVDVEDGFAFFQQIAVNANAMLGQFGVDVYGLIPFGETTQELNHNYNAGALTTFGGDVSHEILPDLRITAGGYYQTGDYNKCLGSNEVDGFGYKIGLNYAFTESFDIGVEMSHDEDFETRVLGNLRYRFAVGRSATNKRSLNPALRAAASSPSHRTVRLHDPAGCFPGSQFNSRSKWR
jgi:hypothetical protein